MFLGAGLVILGFLAAALAERIRTTSQTAFADPRGEEVSAPLSAPRNELPAELHHTPAVLRAPRSVRAEAKANQGNTVINALITAGYTKNIATEATWACEAAERVTVEEWTAAALRRCNAPTAP